MLLGREGLGMLGATLRGWHGCPDLQSCRLGSGGALWRCLPLLTPLAGGGLHPAGEMRSYMAVDSSPAQPCPAHARRTGGGWRQADKPQFDVQHLTYKLKGNNVPMPSTLVKHLLRVFIPEIIQVCRCACCARCALPCCASGCLVARMSPQMSRDVARCSLHPCVLARSPSCPSDPFIPASYFPSSCGGAVSCSRSPGAAPNPTRSHVAATCSCPCSAACCHCCRPSLATTC